MLIKIMSSYIKNFIKKLIFSILYRDKTIFYKDHYNSLSFIHLLFWNLVKPSRSITRIKYNRFLFPNKVKTGDNNIYVETKNKSKDYIIDESSKKLKKYGSVILNEYFSDVCLKNFELEYNDYFNQLNFNPSNSPSESNILPFSKNLSELWFDDVVIKIMEKYIKKIPVARAYPKIVSQTPKISEREMENKTHFADHWHIDHSTIIQPAVYFTDVEEDKSHMEVLVGSHTYPNIANPGYLSNQYVEKKRLTVGKCVGKRGSVQIHCGNIFHRFKAVKDTTRTWLKFGFTSGNSIQLDSQHIALMLKNGFDLSSLDPKTRNIISSIFPVTLYKGYEMDKKTLKPTKFQGI